MSKHAAHSEQAQLDYLLSTDLRVYSWFRSSLTHDGLDCLGISLKANDQRLNMQNNYILYVPVLDVLGSTKTVMTLNVYVLEYIWVSVHCRNLVWHKRNETYASAITTDTSRSFMTETSQLNWDIRGLTKNNFGVIVFHYSNNHYSLSHFIPHGCLDVTNYYRASTKTAFCCLETCSQFVQSKLKSMVRLARQKTGELDVSLVWARSKQIPGKLSLSKGIENGPITHSNVTVIANSVYSYQIILLMLFFGWNIMFIIAYYIVGMSLSIYI